MKKVTDLEHKGLTNFVVLAQVHDVFAVDLSKSRMF